MDNFGAKVVGLTCTLACGSTIFLGKVVSVLPGGREVPPPPAWPPLLGGARPWKKKGNPLCFERERHFEVRSEGEEESAGLLERRLQLLPLPQACLASPAPRLGRPTPFLTRVHAVAACPAKVPQPRSGRRARVTAVGGKGPLWPLSRKELSGNRGAKRLLVLPASVQRSWLNI